MMAERENPTLAGKFKLQHKIGEGSFGEIYAGIIVHQPSTYLQTKR